MSTVVQPPAAFVRRDRASMVTGPLVDLVTALLCIPAFFAMHGGTPPQKWTLDNVAGAFGFMAFLLVWLLGRFGWHGNFYGTIANLFMGKTGVIEAVLRFFAQGIGVWIATLVVWRPWSQNAAGVIAAVPVPTAPLGFWTVFWWAVLAGTIITTAVVLSMLVSSPLVQGLIVGLGLFLAIRFCFMQEGGGANLLRDIVPMLRTGKFFWLSVVGELLGCIGVSLLAKLTLSSRV